LCWCKDTRPISPFQLVWQGHLKYNISVKYTNKLNQDKQHGNELDNLKLLTIVLDRDFDEWGNADSELLADILAESAGVSKKKIKILDLQRGSVVASTVIIAHDWGVVSANLEAAIQDDCNPLKAMGVVGVSGLSGGTVGKALQPKLVGTVGKDDCVF
jgi:hypothetical protein